MAGIPDKLKDILDSPALAHVATVTPRNTVTSERTRASRCRSWIRTIRIATSRSAVASR